MKIIRNFLNVFLLSTIFLSNIFCQTDSPPEIFLANASTSPAHYVQFKIYPVSMVFNGAYRYNLRTNFDDDDGDIQNYYINGSYLDRGEPVYGISVPSGSYDDYGPRHDFSEYKDGSRGAVGFGIYKIEVLDNDLDLIDTLTVEYDHGFPGSLSADLTITFRNDNNGIGGSGPRVNFQWSGGSCSEQNISVVNKKVVA